MSMQFWANLAVGKRHDTKLLNRSCRVVLLLGLLTVTGCAAPGQQFAGPDPSDPSARVAAVRYRSTLGSYRSQRPVEPGDWRDINERVTPQPKPDR